MGRYSEVYHDRISTKLTHDWERMIHVKKARIQERHKGESERTDVCHRGQRQVKKYTHDFCTGSSYLGKWDSLGFAGFGVYEYPHGAVYKGYFKNSEFHGPGDIYYPTGHRIEGKWRKGRLISYRYFFPDGLEYSTPWRYCEMPDRRFRIEVSQGLRPAGEEYETSEQPSPDIPEGCFDTGDGYFDPKTRIVYCYPIKKEDSISSRASRKERMFDRFTYTLLMTTSEPGELVFDFERSSNKPKLKRLPGADEIQFIETRCRKSIDEVVGYRPDLYEFWISGRSEELSETHGMFPDSMSFLTADDISKPALSTLSEDTGTIYSFEFF